MLLLEEPRSEVGLRESRQTAKSESPEEAGENVRAWATGGGRGTEIQHSPRRRALLGRVWKGAEVEARRRLHLYLHGG